jgi:hypothetical protein
VIGALVEGVPRIGDSRTGADKRDDKPVVQLGEALLLVAAKSLVKRHLCIRMLVRERGLVQALVDKNSHLEPEGLLRLQGLGDVALVQVFAQLLTDQELKSKLLDICPVCATSKALNRIPREFAERHYQNGSEPTAPLQLTRVKITQGNTILIVC